MKWNLTFLSLLFFGFVITTLPQTVTAASLYIDPATSVVNRGDSITLAVRLDTDEENGECVNTVDGTIKYSENIEAVDTSIGDSIFRLWIEAPTINPADRTITFAGGIPNGYCGRVAGDPRLTNVLFEIVLQSPGFSVGSGGTTATIDFAPESSALLNDGFGTKAELVTYPAKIELDPRPGTSLQNPWREEVLTDSVPPEEFVISLQLKGEVNADKHYITFSTNDKQTGIDHYEVIEEPLTQFGSFQWGRADAPWVIVNEPENIRYVLNDQSLNSIIRVKAIDKAGNEYVATLIPDDSLRTVSGDQLLIIVAGVGVVILFAVIGLVVWSRIRNRRKTIDVASTKNDEQA